MHIMDEIAVDSNLKLLLVSPDYAEESFETVERNRDLLEMWLPWVKSTTTISDEREYYSKSVNEHKAGKSMEMCIFHRYDGRWKFIGMCGLVTIARGAANEEHGNGSVGEIGYWLDRFHHGRGIVTKCCAKLIETAFTKLDISKLKLIAHKDNASSMAVARRLGFPLTEEKLLQPNPMFHGNPEDKKIFALTKQQWEKIALEKIEHD